MKKLRVWFLATLWFASVSGLSAYGVVRSRETARLRYWHGSESAAVAGLRAYLGSQGTFHRLDRYGKGKRVYANYLDGKGFTDLYRLGGPLEHPDGTEIKLIDLAFARATSPATAKAGYWYVEITADAVSGKPYDYTQDCGLCAVPAVYGETGIHTFVVDLTGTVWKKDNGGRPVQAYPDVVNDDGWEPVGG
ncbi:MAG: DUF2950 family protein [Planctomycetota bacterium]|jgi:hypothetical protein